MSKPKHTHHLAFRIKPRPALHEVWCPGCKKSFYTVEPTACELALSHGSLVVYGAKPKLKRGKR